MSALKCKTNSMQLANTFKTQQMQILTRFTTNSNSTFI